MISTVIIIRLLPALTRTLPADCPVAAFPVISIGPAAPSLTCAAARLPIMCRETSKLLKKPVSNWTVPIWTYLPVMKVMSVIIRGIA